MEGPQTIECKVCGIERLLINNYPSHIEGKKHISRQKIYDREKKTVYVSGKCYIQFIISISVNSSLDL